MKTTPKSIVASLALCLVLALVFVPNIFAVEGSSEHPVATPKPPTSSEPKKTTTEPAKNTSNSGKTTTTEPARTNSDKKTPSTEPSKGSSDTKTDSKRESEDSKSAEKPKDADSTRPDPGARQEIERKKLDDKKKPVCEARQDTINTRMNNVTERSQNQSSRIDTIYTMTTQFYVDKGLSVSNYDQLVANVTSTKVAADAALAALKAAPKLSCDSDGPKADIQSFLNLRLDKVTTFQAYRDAVKTLVEAVKTAAKAAEPTTEGAN